ncbi:MAG TPA: penicillin-binding protein, partial [Polyangiaceae bacterium]|nr:penicillin-binding protein [Polyangiaceae bacterium]
VLTSVLTSVVESGTARAARALGLPIAGKTGTSNEAKDAWFAGYTTEFVCVVWTGYDDAVPLGRRESGATAALPAFMAFMRAAHDKRKVKGWKRPQGVVEVEIDPETGLLPYEGLEKPLKEVFLKGMEPTETAPVPEDGAGGGGGAPGVAASGAGGGAQVKPASRPPEPAPEKSEKGGGNDPPLAGTSETPPF